MGSLLLDSLDFIANQLKLADSNMDDALEAIRERSLRFRVYARSSDDEEQFEIDSSSVQLDESNNDDINVSSNRGPIPNESLTGDHAYAQKCGNSGLPPIPAIPGVDKEVLTNLLMSWFYAGYYTGLAEKGIRNNS
jgi:hypothetical protein